MQFTTSMPADSVHRSIDLPVCPMCGLEIPIDRPVLAARLRCPDPTCGARLQMRAGVIRAA